MLVHLVRHAHALSRRQWCSPDGARPLSDKGHLQAEQIGLLLVAGSVELRSSPAVRCVDTVGPLAKRLGLTTLIDDRLGEARDPQVMVDWMCGNHRVDELVLCGHGDLLPEALRLLQLRGMTLDGPNAVAKASRWTCQIVDGVPIRAAYTQPPAI